MINDKITVVIAEDEPITRMDLSEMLTHLGYNVVCEVSDGNEAILACEKYKPNLLITDVKMPNLDGLSATKVIYENNLADSIVLLTAYNEREIIEDAKKIGVGGYLVKPIDEKSLLPSLEIAMERSKQMRELQNEIIKKDNRIRAKVVVERAKGKLMERYNFTEDEAYNKIRQISKDKNVSMKKIAEVIVSKTTKDNEK